MQREPEQHSKIVSKNKRISNWIIKQNKKKGKKASQLGREKQEDQKFKTGLDCTEFKSSLINTKHSLKKRKKNETSKFQTWERKGHQEPFLPPPIYSGGEVNAGFCDLRFCQFIPGLKVHSGGEKHNPQLTSVSPHSPHKTQWRLAKAGSRDRAGTISKT